MGRFFRFIAILALLSTSILLVSCQKKSAEPASSIVNPSTSPDIQPKTQCVFADDSFRSPESIKEVVDLINALPKPLSIHCFLYNLDLPFNFVATASSFSAQPAPNAASPRIFLIHDSLIISVVPDGFARDSIEFSEVILGTDRSIKADIKFPITETMSESDAYLSIQSSSGGTSCKICHGSETNLGGGKYSSRIIDPDPLENVSYESVKTLTEQCSSENDEFRCEMLKIVLSNSRLTDEGWPF